MEIIKGYRFVTDNLKSEHGDVQWEIGKWRKCEGELALCENGFHASESPLDSLNYPFGTRWFKCEAQGKVLKDGDKFCASKMRLVQEIPERVLRQFAIDCASYVLPIFEKYCPNDNRPRLAIEAAQAYLDNPSDENAQKRAAARAAAGDAAWDAAWAAAGAAAWDAAKAAAWDAAKAAAWEWQKVHLENLIKKELGG